MIDMPKYRFYCKDCSYERELDTSIQGFIETKSSQVNSSSCDKNCIYGDIISFSGLTCKVSRDKEYIEREISEDVRRIAEKVRSGDLTTIENIYGSK
jgi:hypothetical protein